VPLLAAASVGRALYSSILLSAYSSSCIYFAARVLLCIPCRLLAIRVRSIFFFFCVLLLMYLYRRPQGCLWCFFRSLGFTLLCEFSFRFSYRFSGLRRASLNNSAFRLAAHSVCFLVGLVLAIKHLSNHCCSYQATIRPRTFDCRYFSSLDPSCNGGSSIPWCIIFRSARSLSMASLHG